MAIQSSRHQAVLEELTEWWEDLRDRGTGSRVVLVPVPRRWGRSRVLEEFRGIVEDLDGPLTFHISCTPPAGRAAQEEEEEEELLAGRAAQAEQLRDALTTAELGSRAARLLGLDTVAGEVQLGLGIGGLFASGLAAAVPLLLTSLAVTAAGNAWDASPSGQQGAVARAARAVAAVSVAAPVLVTVDNAEVLDLGLAVTMIENLASRYDGQVLVVATVTPGSDLEAELFAPGRYGLLGRVHKADAEPDMSYGARAALARAAGPDLPDVAVERIAGRARDFAEVFAVCGAGKLAEVAQETGAALLADVDTVINAAVERAKVSAEATVLAWAGGALLIRQADRALEIMGAGRQQGDPWVVRSGGLARLTDPAAPRLAEQVAALAAGTRRQLAVVVLEEAVSVAGDPDATLVERVIARQAAHYVRGDLDARGQLTRVQCALIRGLEKLGDPAAAYQVATAALAELPGDDQGGEERREILKAMLRLVRTRPPQGEDPLIEEAVTLALSGGAMLGLEARVWAAAALLDRPGRCEAALKLTDQVAAELAQRPSTEETANQWRLLLAFQAGRAGYPAISQRLLTSMINMAATEQQKAAQAILRAIGGPRADTRLQIIILEAELAARPRGADDDILRLHSALAADYDTLGDYRSALRHGRDELALRQRLQGPDHRQTLRARAWVARWTGDCGDSAQALHLYQELLPDQVRVLGPDHPDTLATRGNLASAYRDAGDLGRAITMYEQALTDCVRVLGPDHPDTLGSRGNLASAYRDAGDLGRAITMYEQALTDCVRVLGPDHPDTLGSRGNLASAYRAAGDLGRAIPLCEQTLTDRQRVLGEDHPQTLTSRNNLASAYRDAGDLGRAITMYEQALTDCVRVLGPDHPDTLGSRGNLAYAYRAAGDLGRAIPLCEQALADCGRVLGEDHPDTLSSRNNLAGAYRDAGDLGRAIPLYEQTLTDCGRVLGPDHPKTKIVRGNLAVARQQPQ